MECQGEAQMSRFSPARAARADADARAAREFRGARSSPPPVTYGQRIGSNTLGRGQGGLANGALIANGSTSAQPITAPAAGHVATGARRVGVSVDPPGGPTGCPNGVPSVAGRAAAVWP